MDLLQPAEGLEQVSRRRQSANSQNKAAAAAMSAALKLTSRPHLRLIKEIAEAKENVAAVFGDHLGALLSGGEL